MHTYIHTYMRTCFFYFDIAAWSSGLASKMRQALESLGLWRTLLALGTSIRWKEHSSCAVAPDDEVISEASD